MNIGTWLDPYTSQPTQFVRETSDVTDKPEVVSCRQDDNAAKAGEALRAVQTSQIAPIPRAVRNHCSYALQPFLVVAATKSVEPLVVFLSLHLRKVAQPVEHVEK